MSAPYHPISCAFHDELLARATLRKVCTLRYLGANGVEDQANGVIEDVYSQGQEEFLRLQGGLTIRLDQIVAVDEIVLPPACD